MSALHYLFGFSGRINRAKIWLWVLIVIATGIVASAIVCVGFDWTPTMTALKAHMHTAAGEPVDWHGIPHPGCKGTITIVSLIALGLIGLAYVWAKLAVYAKRLHDRGRSAWWLLVYVVLPAALQCIGHHHNVPGRHVAVSVAMLIGIWVFIDLFCLKGTTGDNKYGADPLGPNWCDPEKPVKGCTPRPEPKA